MTSTRRSPEIIEDEATPRPMRAMSDMLKGAMARFTFTGSPKQITEYSELIKDAAKMVGMKYIVMHKRIESTFAPATSPSAVLSYLRQWVHEAGKHDKPGMIMNARMKQHREKHNPKV